MSLAPLFLSTAKAINIQKEYELGSAVWKSLE